MCPVCRVDTQHARVCELIPRGKERKRHKIEVISDKILPHTLTKRYCMAL